MAKLHQPQGPDPDQPLVALAQQGDARAFELLVRKYQHRIERLIARQLRDPDMVADVAQESFLRAYRALPGFRGDSAFYTWLYRIALNTARKSLAAARRDPVLAESSLKPGGTDEETLDHGLEPSDTATPEALLASKEMALAVNAAVDELPEEFRQALLLREIEGLGYEEIAARMACPVGTVRSRIYRAREALAARLQDMLEGGSPRRRTSARGQG